MYNKIVQQFLYHNKIIQKTYLSKYCDILNLKSHDIILKFLQKQMRIVYFLSL